MKAATSRVRHSTESRAESEREKSPNKPKLKLRSHVVQKGPEGAKSRLPQPQVVRVLSRHVTGESNREIARAEQIDRKTVARIVRSEEVNAYVEKLREQLYGIGADAVNTVRDAVLSGNALLAYKLISDIGVIPTLQERMVMASQPQSISFQAREKLLAQLSPKDRFLFSMNEMMVRRAVAYDVDVEKSSFPGFAEAVALERAAHDAANDPKEKTEGEFNAVVKAKKEGLELPGSEQMRHNEMVAEAIDEVTGGKALNLSLSNPAKWKELKAIFEEKLREFKEQAQSRPSS